MGVLAKKISIGFATGMLGLVLSGGLTGCTSYTNVPSPDNALYGQDPNARQASAATLAGLRWVVRKHPVSGAYLINLPFGTSTETAERIAASLGPGATIPDGSSMNLPTYHVPRVWIRLSDAKVDVVYPVQGPDGVPFNRGVTAWLHAGVRPWTVSRGQYWIPGTVDVPPTWVPVPQAQLDAMERADREARRAFRRGEAIETPGEPMPTEPAFEQNVGNEMNNQPVEVRVYEPAQQPVQQPAQQPAANEPSSWEPLPSSDPAPAEPSNTGSNDAPSSGSIWREVPTRQGE